MGKIYKASIIGGSIWGNRGAAAMLETTIGKLKEIDDGIEITIFTPYPSIDHDLVAGDQFNFFDSRPLSLIKINLEALWYWLRKKLGSKAAPSAALNALINTNVLLDVGGITFADGRLIFLPYNILTILPSLLFNIPVVKLSQAAGSFKNPIIRLCAKVFLPKCDFIFARGAKTYDYLTDLGLTETKTAIAMDATFVYRNEFCLAQENRFAVDQVLNTLDHIKQNGTSIIGISPSILVKNKMGDDYLSALLNMIRNTANKDLQFVVFPNASREGSKKQKNNDILIIEEMLCRAKNELPKPAHDKITWMPYDIDTKGISDLVSRLDVLLSSRFHAMVFGLRLGIPTLVIGWSHKYLEVMKEFGQEQYVFDYQNTENKLNETLENMLNNNAKIKSEIAQALPDIKKRSQHQFDHLKRFFN